jgi:hypothetical protein
MRPELASQLQNLWLEAYDSSEMPPQPTLALFRLVAEARLPDHSDAMTAVGTAEGDRLALVLGGDALFVLWAPKVDQDDPQIECRRIPLDPSKARIAVIESWAPERRSRPVRVRDWIFDFGRAEKLEFTTHTPPNEASDAEGFANSLAAALGWTL